MALDSFPAPSSAGEDAVSALTPLNPLMRARAWATPRLEAAVLEDGEGALDHAQGVADILAEAGAPMSLQVAAWVSACVALDDALAKSVGAEFGVNIDSLVAGTRQLVKLEKAVRRQEVASSSPAGEGGQDLVERTERVRRMLMAFSRDLRGLLLHLASRLQTLRWHGLRGLVPTRGTSLETLEVLAPLANRLGMGALKWELEDWSFRFLQPEAYHATARLLDGRRVERAAEVESLRQGLTEGLAQAGIRAEVAGRAKHLYSIWRKMQGKRLGIAHVYDLRALRVLVDDVASCYAVLAWLHARWVAVDGEFDDYIARPKPNGYQSLHTVVQDDEGRAVEVQIRTQAMHEQAEHGVAAHWAYKEAGAKGYAGSAVDGGDAARVSQARRAMLDQLLAWERDVASIDAVHHPAGQAEARVYVFTPQGAVIDLPLGATGIDFAYAVHTSLGHRCRGVRVDGTMVPLSTPLQNGQTVEVSVAKEGGPSLDWLNPELGFLASARSRAKVRAWFNEQAHAQTVARGRDRLEKLLQRAGRTASKHAELATRLDFAHVDALYAALGKDELPLKTIEDLWREPGEDESGSSEEQLILERAKARAHPARQRGDVLVVGVDSLLTGLAKCCRPAPPDAIGGFVTRHKGVAIHRQACTNFQHMARQAPARVCAVAWGDPSPRSSALGLGGPRYAVDVSIEALDRPGLLRDLSEVFAKEHLNVSGVQSQSVRTAHDRLAWLTFTVEVQDARAIQQVLSSLAQVHGVRSARRR